MGSQVAYLIDAIRQPKLNGVRGGCSVELRLVKVLPPCSITESCHRTGGTSLLQKKIGTYIKCPETNVKSLFETKPFPTFFHFFLKNVYLLLLPALSSILFLKWSK